MLSKQSSTIGLTAGNSRRRLFITLACALVAAVGVGTYFLSRPEVNVSESAPAQTITKKDIAGITYTTTTTTDSGWDVFYPAGNLQDSYAEANNALFEGLVRYDNDRLVPNLARSWTNSDTTTWVFKLKPGVKFHTGREMTAEDVKRSFEAALPTASGRIYGDAIASVTVNTPLQVTIKTSVPDATFLKKLANYYVYDTRSGKSDDPVNGTGPFVVKPGSVPQEKSLQLIAFDHYHGGHVYLRALNFKQAATAGRTDTISSGTRQSALSYRTISAAQTSVLSVVPNVVKTDGPLARLQVRQAVNRALDPAAIAKIMTMEATPTAQVLPAGFAGYDSALIRQPRDVTAAKELLRQAGYANGFKLSLDYPTALQPAATEIARQLAEAGIRLELVQTIDTLASNSDAVIQITGSRIQDADDILTSFVDSPYYRNMQVKDYLKQARSTFDSTKRLYLLQQANKALSDDLGAIPLYAMPGTTITYDTNFHVSRDISATDQLGIYWDKVYGK